MPRHTVESAVSQGGTSCLLSPDKLWIQVLISKLFFGTNLRAGT